MKLRAPESLLGLGVDWMIVSMSGLGERRGGIVAESEGGYRLAATLAFGVEAGGGCTARDRRVAVDDEARSARVRESDFVCEGSFGVACGGESSNLRYARLDL